MPGQYQVHCQRIKSQIQKDANPEKASRHGYETTYDYLDVLNKRILIQQKTIASLSKALAHILQRELYTMGIQALSDVRLKWLIFNLIWGILDIRNLGAPPFDPLHCSSLNWMEKSSPFKKHP